MRYNIEIELPRQNNPVEADESVLALSQNVTANDSDVVVPVNAAIWDESGMWPNLASGRTQTNSLISKSLKMP